MTKRKKPHFEDEPNLKRYRTEIKSLTKQDNAFKHGAYGSVNLPKQSRKERRKEARLEKKSRRNAYSRRIPVTVTAFAMTLL